jgi:peptidoglycan/xylan/chitin deacetylase (PgdA/CDA1 family)
MLRTGAPSLYGWKTLLRGTLLPAPPVGESAPDLLRRLEGAGHEVGLHGFDHVTWHDGIASAPEALVRSWVGRGVELFEATLGHAPCFCGAPGWQATELALRVQDELGLDFASDCRDGGPFFPEVEGKTLRTLQVPTELPTSDELLGRGGVGAATLAGHYLEALPQAGPVVVGVHAEVEGIALSGWLRDFLGAASARGARFVRLSDLAVSARAGAPVRPVVARAIPGRAGAVACPAVPGG